MKVLLGVFLSSFVVGSFAQLDVDCEGFDTLALCPGGWPSVTAAEAQHRVKCCGAAEAGKCPMCNRCKVGTFENSCCICDDDELVNKFWGLFNQAHYNPNTQADNVGLSERDFVDLVAQVRGEMDKTEQLKVKDVYQAVAMHVMGFDQRATNGLLPFAPLATFLKENPDIVDHIIGEGESPSEGQYTLALDHTKAITPEWFDMLGHGNWGGHIPPPIIRRTSNGLWMVLVPNFVHPENGYLPAVYRHSNQDAKAYVAEKKAEYLEQESKQAQLTQMARGQAATAVGLIHHDRGAKSGMHRYNDQTDAERHRNLIAGDAQTNTQGSAMGDHQYSPSFVNMKNRMRNKH